MCPFVPPVFLQGNDALALEQKVVEGGDSFWIGLLASE